MCLNASNARWGRKNQPLSSHCLTNLGTTSERAEEKTMSKDIREIETTQQSVSKQLNAVNQKILEMEITLTL